MLLTRCVSNPNFGKKYVTIKTAIQVKKAKIWDNSTPDKKYFFVGCLAPRLFDKIIEIPVNNPSPKIKIVKKIEFAIAIAASVLTLCFAATKTSVAPVNTCPRFPMTIGAAITEISAMCFLYLIIVIFSK